MKNTDNGREFIGFEYPLLTKDDIPAVFYRHYSACKNGQLNVSELARVCDMSRTTVYKYIEILER